MAEKLYRFSLLLTMSSDEIFNVGADEHNLHFSEGQNGQILKIYGKGFQIS